VAYFDGLGGTPVAHHWVRPFLRTKRIAGNGKRCLKIITGGVLTLTGFLSWRMYCGGLGSLELAAGGEWDAKDVTGGTEERAAIQSATSR
jgi:hypothetical protein